MVMLNMGLPDPPEHDTSLTSSNDIIIVHSDTDDDNSGNPYEGYQQLPLAGNDNDPAATDSDSNDEDVDANVEPSSTTSMPSIVSTDKVILKEVWSEPQSKDIEMDSDKVKAVKDAMLNFTLPPSSIPEWANDIPEQDWKDHILKRIQDPK